MMSLRSRHHWLSIFLKAGKEIETERPLKQNLDVPENDRQFICKSSARKTDRESSK